MGEQVRQTAVEYRGLPDVKSVGMGAPFRWLAEGWRDLWTAPGPCLAYGLILGVLCFLVAYALVAADAAFWALVLTVGFVFIAPMMAMGLYEAGHQIEQGKTPKLLQMLYVREAVRLDVAYLGLFLALIYLLWGRIAQIIYGLSTNQLHRTVESFVAFATETPDGHNMLITGTVVGGVIAFLTYCMVVISAPMLLDHRTNVFGAIVTSARAVIENFWPMVLWAFLLGALTLLGAATSFLGFIIIVPWLGLASWRAYRELVPEPVAT